MYYSLCYNAPPTMLPAVGRQHHGCIIPQAVTHSLAGRWPATSWVHYTTSCNTQFSAPEDGQDNFPKHVELTGVVNKPLLLHPVGCLYYLYFIIFF